MGMSFQCFGASLVHNVPDTDCFIVTGGEDVLPARVPDYTTDPIIVSNEGEQADAHTNVPDFNRLIPGP